MCCVHPCLQHHWGPLHPGLLDSMCGQPPVYDTWQGVENVYTQHTPLLLSTLESLARGRLRAQDYPSTDRGGAPLVGGRVRGVCAWDDSHTGTRCCRHASIIFPIVQPTYMSQGCYCLWLHLLGQYLETHKTSPLKAPKLVLVCVIGGTTYEEAKAVAELNAAGERGEGWSAGMRVLLGGSAVLNSRTFVKELLTVGDNERYHQ